MAAAREITLWWGGRAAEASREGYASARWAGVGGRAADEGGQMASLARAEMREGGARLPARGRRRRGRCYDSEGRRERGLGGCMGKRAQIEKRACLIRRPSAGGGRWRWRAWGAGMGGGGAHAGRHEGAGREGRTRFWQKRVEGRRA